jgi:hypothetical protein
MKLEGPVAESIMESLAEIAEKLKSISVKPYKFEVTPALIDDVRKRTLRERLFSFPWNPFKGTVVTAYRLCKLGDIIYVSPGCLKMIRRKLKGLKI